MSGPERAGEATTEVPEGAVAVTAKDVLSQPAPEKFEDVEYWRIVSSAGLAEAVRIRPSIGEKGELQVSPLDGSVLALKFEFKGGEKNERTGRQFFPMNNVFHWDIAYVHEAVYKEGESPAEIELKRRAKARETRIEEKAAALAEGLDED